MRRTLDLWVERGFTVLERALSALAAASNDLAAVIVRAHLSALRSAVPDDEPLTEQDLADLEAARREYERGETTPLAEVLAEPGAAE